MIRPFRSWFSKARPVRRPFRRLGVERLEDRSVPATFTWTGASSNPGPKLWTDPNNWSQLRAPTPGTPGSPGTLGDDLRFPTVSGAALNPVDNFPVHSLFGSIEFAGSGYTLSGNGVDLQGHAFPDHNYIQGDANATNNTLALPIRLAPFIDPSTQTDFSDSAITILGNFMGAATTASLSITAAIDNNGNALDFSTALGSNPQFNTYTITGGITGSGDVRFAGATTTLGGTSTFTGGLTLVGGTTTLQGPNPIPDNAAVTLSDLFGFGPAALAIGPAGETIGSLASDAMSTGVVSVPAGATFAVGQNGTNTTFAGAITGGGNLFKTGTGILTLTGTNTYTGTTTIFGGVLSISSDANLGTAPTVPTLGSLALSGTIFSGGTLQATASFTLNPNRGITLPTASTGGGTIAVTNGKTLTYGGVIADGSGGAGVLVKSDSGTLALSGANTYSGGTFVNGGFLSVSSDASLGAVPASPTPNSIVVNGGTLQAAASFTLNANRGVALGANGFSAVDVTGGNTLQIDGIIADFTSGNGSLSRLFKTGPGTLVLTANNTYSRGTTSFAGVVSVSRDANLGPVPASPTPGSIDLEGGALQATASFTLNANRGIVGFGSVPIDVTGANTLTYNGVIADGVSSNSTFPTQLLKTGTGTLVLGGANTYSNGTFIFDGVLSVSSDANLGVVPPTATTSITFAGGTLQAMASFTLNPNRGIVGFVSSLSSVMIDVTGTNTLTYNGVIADGVGDGPVHTQLTKTGAGTLALGGANTYSGGTIIGGGGLSVSSDANLGTAPASPTPGSIIFASGTLQATATFTLNANRGIADSGAFMSVAIDVTGTSTLTYNGVITDPTPSNLSSTRLLKTGTGTLVLGGANTYTGTTFINGGVLSISSDANLGAASPTVGSISINGGTLQATASFLLNAGRTVALGPVSGAGSGMIDVAAGNTLTIPGTVENGGQFLEGNGTGGLVKTGAGTLTLGGANIYSGGTIIGGGVLSVSSDASLGAVPATPTPNSIVIGGELQVTASFTLNANRGIGLANTGVGIRLASGIILTYGGVIADTTSLPGRLLFFGGNSTSTLILTGANTYSGGTQVTSGVLSISSDANLGAAPSAPTPRSLVIRGMLQATASFTLNANRGGDLIGGPIDVTAGNTLTYAGVLTGGALVKIGNGALVLSGANTYSGGTIIGGGGILSVSSDANLGAVPASPTAGLIVFDGGILQATASFTLNSNRGIAGGNALPIVQFYVTGSNTLTYNGIIANASSGPFPTELLKQDTGTLILGGANTYAGATLILVGVLSVSSDANLGAVPASPTAGSIVFGDGILQATASFTLNPNRGITIQAATFDVTGFSNTLTYDGVIASLGSGGVLGLTKTGAGTLVLSGTNTYTSSTTISAGVLSISSDANLGMAPSMATPGALVNNGILRATASFTLNANRGVTVGSGPIDVTAGNTLTYAGVLTGGELIKTGPGTLVLGGANTYSIDTILNGGILSVSSDANLGTVPASPAPFIFDGGTLQATASFTLNANRSIVTLSSPFVTIDATAGNTLTYNGTIANGQSGGSNLVKTGPGTLTLGGINRYAGFTSINGGVLSVSSDANLSTTTNAIAIVGGTLQATASFTLNANRGITIGSAGIDVTAGNTLTYGGAIADGSSGPGSLQVNGLNGSGTLLLSGDSNLAGQTTINRGSLIVTGNYLAPIDINGGLLGGTGQVGNVIADQGGGTLSPGLSPGRLTAARSDSNLTGLTYLAELAGTTAGSGYDQFAAAAGSVNVTNAVLQLAPSFTAPAGSTFDVILAANRITGTFAGLPDGATVTANGQQFVINYNVSVPSQTGGSLFGIRLTAPAAPTPGIDTWTGLGNVQSGPAGGPSNLWSNPLNWSQGVPKNGDELIFPTVSSSPVDLHSNHNDLVGGTFSAIQFTDSGYTLTGSAVTLTGKDLGGSGVSTSYVRVGTGVNDAVALDLVLAPTIPGNSIFHTLDFEIDGTTLANASSLTLAGRLDLGTSGGVLFNSSLATATPAAAVLNVTGPIVGTGSIVTAGNTLNLSGTNSFVGDLDLFSAVVRVSGGAAVPDGSTVALATTAQVSSPAPSQFVLSSSEGGGVTETIGALSGTGIVTLAPSSTLTVGANNRSTTFSGSFNYLANPTLTSTDLVKIGTGALTLSGNSPTLNGSVLVGGNMAVVRGGSLLVTGQFHDGIVLDGGLLGGTGQVASVTSMAGGILSPGLSPGTLTARTNATFNPATTYLAELAGTASGAFDVFAVPFGVVNLGGAVLHLVPSFTVPAGSTFNIVQSSRPIIGTFAGLPNGATVNVGGQQFVITYNVSVPSPTGGSPLFAIRLTKPAVVVPKPTRFFAAGTGAGAPPMVQRFNPDGTPHGVPLMAFNPRFRGGVRVATGDVTGDGVADVVAAAGPGGGPEVDLFDGASGQLLTRFYAFDPRFSGGVHVAVGDINGDGFADIIAAEGSSGSPLVRVFSYAHKQLSVLRSFLAFDSKYSGGVRVAAGDFDGDHKADIVCSTGTFPFTPEVKVFSGATGAVIRNITNFSGNFANGVFVAVGDVNHDGRPDLITGADAGFAPEVRVFDGVSGRLLANFLAFDANFLGGVRVAGFDMNGDGAADVLAAPGIGGGSQLRVYTDHNGSFPMLRQVRAFDPSLTSSVYVG